MPNWRKQNELVSGIRLPSASPKGESSTARHRRLAPFLYTLAAFIALIGLSDSIYLTVRHLTGQNVECLASADCETVLGSSYATLGKVPLAGLGAAAYFAVFSLATLAAFGRAWARPLFLSLVGMMLGVTAWLLYLQAFVLQAFCDFCLLSAALTAILSAIGTAVFFVERRSARSPF